MGRQGFGLRVRGCALASASIIPFLALGIGTAMAQPVGGAVVAGQAQITSAGATTLINQATSKAIINWQDFSVAKGGTVQFNQPSSAAITLNRVTGGNVSAIDGAIRATGQVWLLNPNGLLIGNGAQINVGGLLATTSDIANQDFLAGRYNFSGGGSGAIVNNGVIKAASGGSVVLSAPKVTNSGVVAAKAGKVVLAGTDTFTVDFDGDHLISYAVGASSQAGQVLNSGAIKAAGGNVLLTARAASGVQDGVVNNTGMIEATTARAVNGEIILDAGEGAATSSGSLDASGKGAGQTGGSVQVLGNQVAVSDGAKIDVSGDAGGGTVLIGGNFHGQGSQPHAQNTTVGKAAIKADAIASGNGGKVAVWSDGTTKFAGAISAQGGVTGGNGGQVETSGHYLQVADGASVITAAPFGTVGSWLLDPQDINIQSTGSSDSATGETFALNPSGTATIDPGTLETALAGGDVILQANNDITINSNVTSTSTNSLTLDAGRSINFANSGIITAGTLVLIANDPAATAANRMSGPATITNSASSFIQAALIDITLNSNGTDSGSGDTESIGSGTLPFYIANTVAGGSTSSPIHVKTNGASAFFATRDNGGDSTLAVGFSIAPGVSTTTGIDLGTGALTITAGGVSQTAPILAGAITISQPSGLSGGLPVTLTDPGNAITGAIQVSNIAASAGPTSIVNSAATNLSGISLTGSLTFQTVGAASDLTVSNVSATGGLTLGAGGNLSLGANVEPGGQPILMANGNITQTAPITASGLTASGANITLNDPSNAIGGLVTLTSAGAISFSDTSAIVLGPVGNGSGPATSSITIVDTNAAPTAFSSTIAAAGAVSIHATGGIATTGTPLIFADSVDLQSSAGVIGVTGAIPSPPIRWMPSPATRLSTWR